MLTRLLQRQAATARIVTTLLLALSLSITTGNAFAQFTFEWWAYRPGGTVAAQVTGLKSYEEALRALRVYVDRGESYWTHADPSLEPSPYTVFNSFLPNDGYRHTSTYTWGPTINAACAAAAAEINGGTCVYLGPASRLDNPSWNDRWACRTQCPDAQGNPYITYGVQVMPRCPEPGYSWSDYGGFNSYPGQPIISGVCYSSFAGAIYANGFDPQKPDYCSKVGNPIQPALGGKTQAELVYQQAAASDGLVWEFLYSSLLLNSPIRQSGWSHTYSRALFTVSTLNPVRAFRDDGYVAQFTLSGGLYASDGDVKDRLIRLADAGGATTGWTYAVAKTEELETYDATGRLVSIQGRTGKTRTLTYSDSSTPTAVAPKPGLLIVVRDAYGRSMNLGYDAAARITSLSDPQGQAYSFTYGTNGALSAVVYPGNKIKAFLYEDPLYQAALTGIVDENGNRFATYGFDAHGRATTSEHAGGAGRVSLLFNADYTTTVTDSLGTQRVLSFAVKQGAIRSAGSDIPYPDCGVLGKSAAYDSYGNVTSTVDYNDKRTCSSYDLTRNLETARVEGALAAESCPSVLATLPSRADVRKTTTQWHANWRLPTIIAQPNLRSTFFYNGDGGVSCAPPSALVGTTPIGAVCKKTLQETTDATGAQGLAATTTGTLRTWQYTYDAYGQLLTTTDPNGKATTNVYYASADPDVAKRGNVATITNPLGHVTQITAYDANGRPLAISDPNGLVTTLSYHPRGWLAARTVGGETTSYGYDGAGQLTKVTQPDGHFVQYTYDAAHRLTQLQDGLNNRIVYTLDALGNRIKEEAFDPAGTLARTRQQVYDSLKRLHQTVGAQ